MKATGDVVAECCPPFALARIQEAIKREQHAWEKIRDRVRKRTCQSLCRSMIEIALALKLMS